MIKSLKIKNFESWEDAELEFHPGINVIIGESDEGKSGLIRAIKLNTLNRPKGFNYRSDFVTNNKDLTSVEIEYDSGDKITRQRNLSGTNEYQINNGESLVALRTDVPTEVSDISKISSINIQGQHPTEQYFLLSERPGYVAKEFNKVADLTIMDKAIYDINSQVRSAKSELTIYQKELKEKKNQLKKDEWIFEAKEKADEIRTLNIDISCIDISIDEIYDIVDSLKENKYQLSEYKNVKKAQKQIEKLILSKSKIIDLSNIINSLNSDIKSIKKITSALKETSDINEALNALKTIKKLKDQKEEIQDDLQKIGTLIQLIENSEKKYQKAEKEFQETEKLFHEKYQNEKCPTCGRIGK